MVHELYQQMETTAARTIRKINLCSFLAKMPVESRYNAPRRHATQPRTV